LRAWRGRRSERRQATARKLRVTLSKISTPYGVTVVPPAE
jgi:hypothetical protein